MEHIIEYVLYKNVKDNEYINRIKPINDAVKKLKKTKNGMVMEEFYDFSRFKNIRTIQELSDALKDGEYLIIDLNKIKEEDEKLQEEDKLYGKIRETIDEHHIVPYVYHSLEKQKKAEREIGEKLHLIKYDELHKSPINPKNAILVQLKVNEDQTCTCESISFSSMSKRQLDEELSYNHGGYSGLYYLIPSEEIENLNSYYEITKIEDGKWDFIKMNKSKNK